MPTLFCFLKNSGTEETYNNLTKKMKYFHVQPAHILFTMRSNKKHIENPHAGKKRKAWNTVNQQNRYRNKWKRKLAKFENLHTKFVCITSIILITTLSVKMKIKICLLGQLLVKLHKNTK